MDTTHTIENLDHLYLLRKERENINAYRLKEREAAMPAEVAAQLEEIEAKFAGMTAELNSDIGVLESQIKEDVAAIGKTVAASHLMAVWSRGRVSWDDKALVGYMKAHPELAEFRVQGMPTVSIRTTAAGMEREEKK